MKTAIIVALLGICGIGCTGCSAKGPGITLADMQNYRSPYDFSSRPPPRGARFTTVVTAQVPKSYRSESVVQVKSTHIKGQERYRPARRDRHRH